MVFSQQFRTTRSANDGHWQSNFWIRVTQVIIAIVSLIIASVAISIPTEDGVGFGAAGAWIFYLVAWICTTLWAIAHFIRLGTSQTPIHPGAIVGVDLVLWLLYLVASIFGFAYFVGILILKSSCANGDYSNDYGYGGDYEGSYYDYYNPCDYVGNIDLSLAASIFQAFGGLVILILHFYLFVRGCIDVHRRRRAQYAALAVPANGNYAYVPPTAQFGNVPYNVPMPTGQAVYQQTHPYTAQVPVK